MAAELRPVQPASVSEYVDIRLNFIVLFIVLSMFYDGLNHKTWWPSFLFVLHHFVLLHSLKHLLFQALVVIFELSDCVLSVR